MIAPTSDQPTREQIDAVLAFLPAFERDGVVASRVEKPPGQIPYHVFSNELRRFHQAVYDKRFVLSFDWPAWQEEAKRYLNEPDLLHDADLQVLRKLITVHVRKQRFCDGHLPAMIECGHVAALLRRLRELRHA